MTTWLSTFRKFYNTNKHGGSSRWLVAPNVVEVFVRDLLVQAKAASAEEEREWVLKEVIGKDEQIEWNMGKPKAKDNNNILARNDFRNEQRRTLAKGGK